MVLPVFLWIDDILRASFDECADIGCGDIDQSLAGFSLRPGHVGGDDAVGDGEQGIVCEDWLLRYHINCRSPYLSGVKRSAKCFFINQRSSGGVQNNHTVFHLLNGIGVDDSLGFWKLGTVKRNDIAAAQQGIQIHIPGNRFSFGAGAAAVSDDIHTQRLGDLSYSLADPAESDDTHSLSGQFHLGSISEAEIRTSSPFALMDNMVVVTNPVAEFQQ